MATFKSWILEVRLLSLVSSIECYLHDITWFNLNKLMEVKNQFATDVVSKLSFVEVVSLLL